MKNHSCIPGCTNGLRSICGTAIDLDDLEFAPSQNQLLYMDKIYSKGEGTACPLVFNLTTTPTTFQTQLFMSPFFTNNNENLCEEIFGKDCYHNQHSYGCEQQNCHSNCTCNCNCSCLSPVTSCQLSEDAVFDIMKSYVKITSFRLENPYNLSNDQVTVDGNMVDSLNYSGGSYEADITSSLPNIIKHPCAENNLPTKAFFLICQAGPWVYQAEFVLEGTVTTNGSTCCFRAIFTTLSESPINPSIDVCNIAVPKISIPCVSGGMSPRLFFNFNGNMKLINPEIHVVSNSDNDTFTLILDSCISAEPTVNVEVLKKSLFCVNACEALFPCEGTESAVESAEDEDDTPLTGPVCHCGTQQNVESIEDSTCGNTLAYEANSFCSNCCRGF